MSRPSRIPQQIMALMQNGQRHAWTLDQLASDLALAGQKADFSSVYRAVERLLAESKLTRIAMGDAAARFELPQGHHDHVRCSLCDRVAAIPCLLRKHDLETIQAQTGFSVASHSVVLDGVCSACRAASPQT